MSRLPKLKVTTWDCGYQCEEIRDFEQAKDFLNFDAAYVVRVEGQIVSCYDQLVRLAAQDWYKDKEFLEVTILPLIGGG